VKAIVAYMLNHRVNFHMIKKISTTYNKNLRNATHVEENQKVSLKFVFQCNARPTKRKKASRFNIIGQIPVHLR
jgi:hypothetical protein